MKSTITSRFKLFFLSLIVLNFWACESYLGEDINADPNSAISVPINAQLPAIELALVDLSGGVFSRISCMLSQQIEGLQRRCLSMNAYLLTANVFNTPWTIVYEDILNEIRLARVTAEDNGYLHYQGVLNVIEAYTLMMATDVWDDMPYSEALKGIDQINPKYDTQAEIYTVIEQRLVDAQKLFQGPSGEFAPGNDDIMNQGNIDAWVKAAHAIKARKLLKEKDYSGAMSEAMMSFDGSEQNLAFQYPDANAAANWYRFNRDRTGDIEFHPQMRYLMLDRNDTDRLAVMDQIFDPANTYINENYKEELLTYREMQFVIAEADVRLNPGGTQQGYDALLNGIRGSFDRLGLDQTAYDNYIAQTNVVPTPGNITLEAVMIQKYIAMYLLPEVYSDWRRTNIPALTPVSGSSVPVRWPYSANEYQFNSSAPEQATVDIFQDRVGWNR